jgi:glycosyltransferase involved in cell wall biosynthesis
MNDLVSICIPTYKQPELLELCLQSILVQTHQQFDVHITDDTPNDSVKAVVDRYSNKMNVSYQKNKKPLGSPANWNEALSKATGRYILLLHHDDAFSSKESLCKFVQPFIKDETVEFVFGRNQALEEKTKGNPLSGNFFKKYYRDPELLLTGNLIGAPSNVMVKLSALEMYNINYKWIVDIEYYIRLFRKKNKYRYIDDVLINIGIHEGQVTNDCINNNDVLLYEYLHYAISNELKANSIKLYDFYWRLIRNTKAFSFNQLASLGLSTEKFPKFIRNMIVFQRKMPFFLLRLGVISKMLMSSSYLLGGK